MTTDLETVLMELPRLTLSADHESTTVLVPSEKQPGRCVEFKFDKQGKLLSVDIEIARIDT